LAGTKYRHLDQLEDHRYDLVDRDQLVSAL
jgi:hypothetical protein